MWLKWMTIMTKLAHFVVMVVFPLFIRTRLYQSSNKTQKNDKCFITFFFVTDVVSK